MVKAYARVSVKTFKPAATGGGTGGGQTPVSTEYYYVDVNGDDANDGLSPAKAIQTLTRVNSLPFTTTRKVLFKRGQSWIGTITLNASGTAEMPIIIDSYGSGALPVIEGSTEINGWTLHQGNIYKASLATSVNQLFVNNDRMQAARFPASGFATVTTAPSTSSLTCNELDGVINHTGAKCLIHSSSYGLDTKDVTASVSKTLTLNAVPFGNVDAGEKFILVGKLEYLTAPGQWYYDSTSQTVYLWKTDGSQPAAGEVRGSIVDYGFVANNKSFFQVRNIEFDRHKGNGIHLTGCSNFNINNVSVNYPDAKGIRDSNSNSALFHTNTVRGANHLGIESYTTNSTFFGNKVYDTCLFTNLGHSGIGSWYMGSGIYVEGDNNIADQNRIDEVGYNGIHYNGKNYVYRNFVTNFCRTKNDGGGIYTSASVNYQNESNKGSIIRYNHCLYGWGVSALGFAYAEGIYLDESSGGVTEEFNTVAFINGSGYFLHKGNNHTLRYNTSYLNITGFTAKYDARNVVFENNFVFGGLNQRMVHLNGITGTPTLNNNKYINPATEIFRVNDATNYNFSNWKSTLGYDINSEFDGTALPAGYSSNILINPTAITKRYYFNNATSVKNVNTNTAVTGSYIDVAAYGSIIVTGLNVDCIQEYSDSVAPVLTAFEMASNSSQSTVSPLTIEATGNPTKYILTESNVKPALTAAGWSEAPSYTFSTEGVKTLYLWARDAAGNISESMSANITIEESVFEDVVAWYEFENSGITLADKTSNNLDASNKTSANADRDVTPVSGLPGLAYPYISTGLQKSIVPDNVLLDFTGIFTIAAWVNVTSLSGFRVICSKHLEFAFYVSTNGAVVFRVYENGTTNYTDTSTPVGSIVTGNDYLIEVKADGTNSRNGYRIYINVVEQTRSFGGNIADLTLGIVHGANDFIIGFSTTMNSTMYGKLSQLSFWNKAISANVRNKFWNSGNGVNYPAV